MYMILEIGGNKVQVASEFKTMGASRWVSGQRWQVKSMQVLRRFQSKIVINIACKLNLWQSLVRVHRLSSCWCLIFKPNNSFVNRTWSPSASASASASKQTRRFTSPIHSHTREQHAWTLGRSRHYNIRYMWAHISGSFNLWLTKDLFSLVLACVVRKIFLFYQFLDFHFLNNLGIDIKKEIDVVLHAWKSKIIAPALHSYASALHRFV